MFKKIVLVACLALTSMAAFADEGMWLPLLIGRLNYQDMQKNGLKLTADEIYNVNKGSLKDAIVVFGEGFCTGEVISKQGLILTNHHCGYDLIQQHSSVQNDYLTNGFWAMSKDKEIPNPGLTVSFLVRVEDVTAKIMANLNPSMSEKERNAAVAKASAPIRKEAEAGTNYNTQLKSFYNGNEYYLFVYERFSDVRLVGAPPSSIGKFGGDTDNWMWPRHTGDFSMFRVYANKDNKSAPYSKDNVPYTPKHSLPVSMSGVKENDFSMIMGYPGTTDRYLTSFGVKLQQEVIAPLRVKIRAKKLEIMKQDMDASDVVRIKYASSYAGIANYWKYFIGQGAQLKNNHVAERKQKEEAAVTAFINQDAANKQAYSNALPNIEAAYKGLPDIRRASTTFSEIFNDLGALTIALETGRSLQPLFDAKPKVDSTIKREAKDLKAGAEKTWKDYNEPTERKLTAAMLQLYMEETPLAFRSAYVATLVAKYKNDYTKLTEDLYKKSVFASQDKYNAFTAKPEASVTKDPIYLLANDLVKTFTEKVRPATAPFTELLDKGNREYVAAMLKMDAGVKNHAPNANSTMRLTYGKVLPYIPRDAVDYKYFTTLDGIMEKEDPKSDEFTVPAKLKTLWQTKNYGPYAENGTMKVGFITNTDITGGNSGSPVINARGELVGTAFDGNWEAMSGDIAFENKLQRTIACDIRYILFIIDKYADAKHLVDEMNLVYAPTEVITVPTMAPAEPVAPAPVITKPVTKPAAKPAQKPAAKKAGMRM